MTSCSSSNLSWVGLATSNPFVRNAKQCWAAYQLAKTYRCRPSELYGITEQPAAFYFDRAIGTFGVFLENKLAEAEKGKKSENRKAMARNMVLMRYLGTGAFAQPGR